MKRRISILLVLTLLLLVAVPMAVSGEETEYDWDNMDWETFDWSLLQGGTILRSLNEWLQNEADYSDVFHFMAYKTTEFMSESYMNRLLDIFTGDPAAFLIALAEEDQWIQHSIISNIRSAMVFEYDISPMIKLIEGIRLNRNTHPEAVELLLILIEEVELRFGVSITAPPTGDPVMLSVLGLVCSSAGMLLLKKRKRTV